MTIFFTTTRTVPFRVAYVVFHVCLVTFVIYSSAAIASLTTTLFRTYAGGAGFRLLPTVVALRFYPTLDVSKTLHEETFALGREGSKGPFQVAEVAPIGRGGGGGGGDGGGRGEGGDGGGGGRPHGEDGVLKKADYFFTVATNGGVGGGGGGGGHGGEKRIDQKLNLFLHGWLFRNIAQQVSHSFMNGRMVPSFFTH